MDRMNPIDVSFLHIEDSDPSASLHIGSVCVFEGPAPAQEALAAHVAGRLDRVPRYRQRVARVPLDLGRPVWVDDDHFELAYHLRRTALPAPGDERALRRLTGRLMSQRLDRSKPLWEMWIVEGLADDRWAMVNKVHHCLVDGVAGSELLAVILDLSSDPPPTAPTTWAPEPAPSAPELTLDALRRLATDLDEQVRAVGSLLRRRQQLVDGALRLVRGLGSLRQVVAPESAVHLTGPIGPHRDVAWAEVPLDDVKRIRRALGGTVNDVVLAAIAGGFRELLTTRGLDVAHHTVRSLVPVSVRATRDDGAATGDGALDNKISGMIAVLPVGEADPVEALHAVRHQLEGIKQSHQAVAGEALASVGGFTPPALLALGTRVAARLAARTSNVHTVTTNVPGPQVPLYMAGRRMLRSYPYVPVGAPLRTGVAIFSYDGVVTFGVTGDRDTASDVEVLARGIEASLDALLAAAGAAPTPARSPEADAEAERGGEAEADARAERDRKGKAKAKGKGKGKGKAKGDQNAKAKPRRKGKGKGKTKKDAKAERTSKANKHPKAERTRKANKHTKAERTSKANKHPKAERTRKANKDAKAERRRNAEKVARAEKDAKAEDRTMTAAKDVSARSPKGKVRASGGGEDGTGGPDSTTGKGAKAKARRRRRAEATVADRDRAEARRRRGDRAPRGQRRDRRRTRP